MSVNGMTGAEISGEGDTIMPADIAATLDKFSADVLAAEGGTHMICSWN